MTTGRVPSGRGQHKIGRCGSSMMRPSPNQGTLWLHNDDDDDVYIYILLYIYIHEITKHYL